MRRAEAPWVFSMPITNPGTHMGRSVPMAPWRPGAVSTLRDECQAPKVGWEAASLPMAPQTPAHLKVRPLLTWSLSEALFLLGKMLSCSPSMGRVGRGPPRHPVPLPRATCPMSPHTSKGLGSGTGGKQRGMATLQAGMEADGLPQTAHPTRSRVLLPRVPST